MSEWQLLTTRGSNKPKMVNRRRGRPRTIMPKTRKDFQQDKQIKNINRKVKKLQLDEELKHVDVLLAAVEMTSDPGTTQTQLLNPLSLGDTDITREGNLCRFTSLQAKGTIILRGADLIGSDARVIFFWDNSPNGVAPTAANLLDLSVITAPVNAPYNSDYFKRFKIIYDRRFEMNPILANSTTLAGAVTTLTTSVPLRIQINFRKSMSKRSNYGLGNAGTIADISIGACYVLLLSSRADGTDAGPQINLGTRMYFKDI